MAEEFAALDFSAYTLVDLREPDESKDFCSSRLRLKNQRIKRPAGGFRKLRLKALNFIRLQKPF